MTENTGNDVKNTETIGIEAFAMDKYRNLPPDQKEIVKFRANKTVELLKERQKERGTRGPIGFGTALVILLTLDTFLNQFDIVSTHE